MESNKKRDQFEMCFREGEHFLSLDISTVRTGYAVYRIEKELCICTESGVICGKGRNAKERFPNMAKQIVEKICTKNVSCVVAEGAFYRKSFSSIEYLLKLHGIAEYCAFMLGIPFQKMVTTAWRSECGFPRNFDKEGNLNFKELSKNFASTLLKRSVSDDNEADAVCIGYAFKNKCVHIIQ